MDYMALSAAEWQQEYDKVSAEYESWKAKGLKLNMARGKPSKQQLDLVSGILTALTSAEECVDSGVDARNYGELKGLESARKLFADILGCKTSQVFAGGNSSLQLMYDTVSKAYSHGLLHSEKPWCKEESVKWLCPAPGYDRHFKVTESFGFELITIPMTENGPDMDIVEHLIKDPRVKGMWNVPKYSNPDGIISTRPTLIRRARHRGLLTVQRAFILDSLSLTSLSGQLEQGKPDFVEILPGIMPRVIAEISARTQVPVIAGGLLRDKADVMAAMRAGAAAVSTSAPSLWDI